MTRPQSWMLPILAAFSLSCLTAQAAAPLRSWPVEQRMPVNEELPGADATVRAVQYLLAAHGLPVAPDGFFRHGTEAALRQFQTAHHLVASGKTNNPTWEALIVPLHLGSRGAAVKAAQTEFRDAGYAVAVDGVFGPEMKAVTKTFQVRTAHTADGVIGRSTWYELVGGASDTGAGYD